MKTRKPKKLNKKQTLKLQALIAEIKSRCNTTYKHLETIRKFRALQKVGKKRKFAHKHIQQNMIARNSIIALPVILCTAMHIINRNKRLKRQYSDLELLVRMELQREIKEKETNETTKK